MEYGVIIFFYISVVYAVQGKNNGRDMYVFQCYSCNVFGYIVRDYFKNYCYYCKNQGYYIFVCFIRSESKYITVFRVSTGVIV